MWGFFFVLSFYNLSVRLHKFIKSSVLLYFLFFFFFFLPCKLAPLFFQQLCRKTEFVKECLFSLQCFNMYLTNLLDLFRCLYADTAWLLFPVNERKTSTHMVFRLKNSLSLQQFWLFSSFKYLISHFYCISSPGKWIQAFYPFSSSLDWGYLFRWEFCWFLFLSIMLGFLLEALVEMSDWCFSCELLCSPWKNHCNTIQWTTSIDEN